VKQQARLRARKAVVKVGFSAIPDCMTLNGYFALNSALALVYLSSDRAKFLK